jgi:hypothetical protein
MASAEQCIKYFLGLGEVTLVPQVTKVRYKVNGKIALTHNVAANRFCMLLSEADQANVITWNPQHIHPVPNKFGLLGFTLVYYLELNVKIVQQLLEMTYKNANKPKVKTTKVKTLVVIDKEAKYYKQDVPKNMVAYFSTKADKVLQQFIIDAQGRLVQKAATVKPNKAIAIDAQIFERVKNLAQ